MWGRGSWNARTQILLGYVPVAVANRDAAVARSRNLYYQFCDEMVCATPGTADTTHDHVKGSRRKPAVHVHARLNHPSPPPPHAISP